MFLDRKDSPTLQKVKSRMTSLLEFANIPDISDDNNINPAIVRHCVSVTSFDFRCGLGRSHILHYHSTTNLVKQLLSLAFSQPPRVPPSNVCFL